MNSSNLSDFLIGLCSDVKDKEEDEFTGGERGCIAEDGLNPSSLEGTQNEGDVINEEQMSSDFRFKP